MSRALRWEMALDAYLVERMRMPFAWGTNDCATFAAEWIHRCVGVSLFDANYTDADGAAHEIAKRGGMDKAVADVLGEPLETPRMAQRGDVALASVNDRKTLVVVIGASAVGPGKDGLAAVPISDLVTAWRI